MGVAEVMKPNMGHTSLLDNFLERMCDGVWVEGLSV